MHRLRLIVAVAIAGSPVGVQAQDSTRTVQLVPSELAGFVRDTANQPLKDAEVLIPSIGKTVRTDQTGKFALVGIQPGVHEVWFRSIGFTSVQFDWPAVEGQRTELTVTLKRLPYTLDPVRVWANERRTLASTAVVTGFVVDTAGRPIPNAELQLIGATRSTTSAGDGSFTFRHVPTGTITIRARHLGFGPAAITTEMLDEDLRQMVLRLRPLEHMLDTVKVSEESGYGSSEIAWRELDRRDRWRSTAGGAAVIGPQRLREAATMPLDLLLAPYMSGHPATRSGLLDTRPDPQTPYCVLENGKTPRVMPLWIYKANDVDRIEYFPPAASSASELELTGTVELHMRMFPQCGKNPAGGHPAYFVVWLRSAK